MQVVLDYGLIPFMNKTEYWYMSKIINILTSKSTKTS